MPSKYQKGFTTGRYLDDGKPERIWVRASSKRDFERKCAEVRHNIDQGIYVKNNSTSFQAYAESWLEGKRPTISVNRYDSYKYTLKNHFDPIRYMKLKDIRPSDLQSLVSSKESAYVQNNVRLLLRQVFQLAMDDRIIYDNPASKLKTKKIEPKERRALSDDEKNAIRALKDEGAFTPMEKLLIDTLFVTGMRKEEALALMKSDFSGKVVNVSRALQWRGGKALKPPKSKAGYRSINIPKWYIDEVATYDTEDSLYLFHGRDRAPISESSYKKMFKSIKGKINAKMGGTDAVHLTDLTAYTFRHNYVTMLYYKGVSVKEAQRLAGHSNIRITLEIYSHLDESLEETDEKIEGITL